MASVHASFANKKQRLRLKEWHDILGCIDPAAIKPLQKRGPIQVSDTTLGTNHGHAVHSVPRMQISSSLLRKRRSNSETPGEVIHTEPEGLFHPDVTGIKYFQVSVDETTRGKRIRGLKTRDAAADATAHYIDKMAREGAATKCISGDGAGEPGRSVKFQRVLVDRGIRWKSSPTWTPQSNGIAERAIQQLMRIERSQPVKAGRGEDYWFFAVVDAAFKTAGMPHEFIGGETPCERLTGKPTIVSVCGEQNDSCIKTNNNVERARSSTHTQNARWWSGMTVIATLVCIADVGNKARKVFTYHVRIRG